MSYSLRDSLRSARGSMFGGDEGRNPSSRVGEYQDRSRSMDSRPPGLLAQFPQQHNTQRPPSPSVLSDVERNKLLAELEEKMRILQRDREVRRGDPLPQAATDYSSYPSSRGPPQQTMPGYGDLREGTGYSATAAYSAPSQQLRPPERLMEDSSSISYRVGGANPASSLLQGQSFGRPEPQSDRYDQGQQRGEVPIRDRDLDYYRQRERYADDDRLRSSSRYSPERKRRRDEYDDRRGDHVESSRSRGDSSNSLQDAMKASLMKLADLRKQSSQLLGSGSYRDKSSEGSLLSSGRHEERFSEEFQRMREKFRQKREEEASHSSRDPVDPYPGQQRSASSYGLKREQGGGPTLSALLSFQQTHSGPPGGVQVYDNPAVPPPQQQFQPPQQMQQPVINMQGRFQKQPPQNQFDARIQAQLQALQTQPQRPFVPQQRLIPSGPTPSLMGPAPRPYGMVPPPFAGRPFGFPRPMGRPMGPMMGPPMGAPRYPPGPRPLMAGLMPRMMGNVRLKHIVPDPGVGNINLNRGRSLGQPQKNLLVQINTNNDVRERSSRMSEEGGTPNQRKRYGFKTEVKVTQKSAEAAKKEKKNRRERFAIRKAEEYGFNKADWSPKVGKLIRREELKIEKAESKLKENVDTRDELTLDALNMEVKQMVQQVRSTILKAAEEKEGVWVAFTDAEMTKFEKLDTDEAREVDIVLSFAAKEENRNKGTTGMEAETTEGRKNSLELCPEEWKRLYTLPGHKKIKLFQEMISLHRETADLRVAREVLDSILDQI